MESLKNTTIQLLKLLSSSVVGIIYCLWWDLETVYRKVVPPPMKSLNGETILVTGALGGVGRELCKSIVNSSFHIKLVIWDLNFEGLKEFALDLESIGKSKGVIVYPQAVDISKEENIQRASAQLKDNVGPVTVIFNNAGVLHSGNFLQLTSSQIKNTFDVNVLSAIWIIREFLPEMLDKDHGRIVNICSASAFIPFPQSSCYSSSKYAISGLSESLRYELNLNNVDGIRVTAVYPYIIRTQLASSFHLAKKEDRPFILPDFLEPDNVARTIVDGVRREYEQIYLPCHVILAPIMYWLFPSKVVKYITMSCISSVRSPDVELLRNIDKIK